MKKILLICIFCLISLLGYAQQISGPTEVTGGTYGYYTFRAEISGISTGAHYNISCSNSRAVVYPTSFTLWSGERDYNFDILWPEVNEEAYIYVQWASGGTTTRGSAQLKVKIKKYVPDPDPDPDPEPTCYTTYSNKTISSNQTIKGCENLSMANVTIQTGKTVNITAGKKITISPSFHAASGSTVSIKATSATLRSTQAEFVEEEGTTGIEELQGNVLQATLLQNAPNPFSYTTTIGYNIPESAKQAYIAIYNLQGGLVKQISINAVGKGELTLQANELAQGMYLYSLFIDGIKIDTKRMVVQ